MAKKPKRADEKAAQREVFSHFSPLANLHLNKTRLLALQPGIQVIVPISDADRKQFSGGRVFTTLGKVFRDDTAEIKLSGYDQDKNELTKYKIFSIRDIKPLLHDFINVTREHIITLAENTLFQGRYLNSYGIKENMNPAFLKELGSFTFAGFKEKDFIWCMDQFWNIYIISPGEKNLNLHFRIENLPHLHVMLRMWGYDLYGYNQN